MVRMWVPTEKQISISTINELIENLYECMQQEKLITIILFQ